MKQRVALSIKGQAFRVLSALCGGVERPDKDVGAAILEGLELTGILPLPSSDPRAATALVPRYGRHDLHLYRLGQRHASLRCSRGFAFDGHMRG